MTLQQKSTAEVEEEEVGREIGFKVDDGAKVRA